HLPLTVRQIFYRLVGAHGYDKTEHAYKRLGEHLNRARRARIIAMDDIRDDGGVIERPIMWASAQEWLDATRRRARTVLLDRTEGPRPRLPAWCRSSLASPSRMVFPSCQAAGSKARRTSIDLPKSLPATIAQPRCCTSATTTRAARTCSWRSLRTWKRSHAILGARRPLHALP